MGSIHGFANLIIIDDDEWNKQTNERTSERNRFITYRSLIKHVQIELKYLEIESKS